ncbi:putative vps51/Vps67 [Lyophyllum shimeji]|uniref:Conserved oligomeric Golgi complex subunit 1 n=1 Tax=Lyophyllum shimeji TaxID=47721 RepID=A0A9P3PH03_LYOSH|nr:putative vps51/Vps67 [Lyophyllum shimeji]
MSVSKLPPVDDTQGAYMDPDELFEKHTISEVKFVQQRLRRVAFRLLVRYAITSVYDRADADAKQEELRLMVGERYRDLLQASTSIIAIAKSSHRVQQALEETKDAILSQEEPPLPQRPSLDNDAHLHTLQLLSAHMKLLLDAPEHLWRLIERKKYLPAAWLFLLARVVHRALVRDDEQDEGTWSSQGVDVLEEFPLVQRQWETVSQFRSQIIHKATLSLREYNASAEDTCATLLTLHLLDSQPLTETLSVFLAQRSRTLQTMLSWKYEDDSPNPPTKRMNGHAPEKAQPNAVSSEFRRRPVNQIKEATHSAFDAISQTVKTAQSIFQEESNAAPSLIRRVLEYIQSDPPKPPETTQALPMELYLTTQTLLSTLPSSTHFLLLPPNLRSYKPYVDLNSSSSSMQQSLFAQKMDQWFRTSSSSLQKSVRRWFADLQSLKEVWSVRSSARRWLLASGLDKDKIVQMTGVLDELCQHRVIEIWKLKLAGSLESFGARLDSALSSLTEGSKTRQKQASSSDFLFQAPPLPTLSQANLGPMDASLQKYKASLRQQLIGRTSLLDDVLATLENCARTIREDLARVIAGGDEARQLVQRLEETYKPDASAFCGKVVQKLEKSAELPNEDSREVFSLCVSSFAYRYSAWTTDGLVFLARVSDELSSSSPFIAEIGCQPSIMQDFRGKTAALHDRVIDRWRTQTVARIVHEHRLAFRPIHAVHKSSLKPSGPSSDLVQSLLALSNSVQEVEVTRNPSRQRSLVQTTVKEFVTVLTGEGWDDNGVQSLHDLAFLWKLADVQGEGSEELRSRLEKRLEENVSATILIDPHLRLIFLQLPAELSLEDLRRSASESLARMQTLFSTLLPQHISIPLPDSANKSSALLPFGIPALDQQFQPAVELAKPTSRFGLLLVGGV